VTSSVEVQPGRCRLRWKLWGPVFAGLGLFNLVSSHAPARTGHFTVSSSPIAAFGHLSSDTDFGTLSWRGGLILTSDNADFGGLSGLILSDDCTSLLSVSDEGRWFKAELGYTGGKLSGISNARMEPLRDAKGKPLRDKDWADSEAITDLGKGKVGVAFEHKVRFGSYDLGKNGFDALFKPIAHPKEVDRGPENGEVEAFGRLPSGDYIAIAERQRDKRGNLRAWIWHEAKVTSFTIERKDRYLITDLAVLANGDVLTMERNFNRSSLPGMAVRRFKPSSAKQGSLVKPETVIEATMPFYAIDNMEGIAVCERDGETRVTLQSDNNFFPNLQSTILLQFVLKP
jgi:hypothetical protein